MEAELLGEQRSLQCLNASPPHLLRKLTSILHGKRSATGVVLHDVFFSRLLQTISLA